MCASFHLKPTSGHSIKRGTHHVYQLIDFIQFVHSFLHWYQTTATAIKQQLDQFHYIFFVGFILFSLSFSHGCWYLCFLRFIHASYVCYLNRRKQESRHIKVKKKHQLRMVWRELFCFCFCSRCCCLLV